MKTRNKNEINVMIATPAYDGKVNVQYCLSFSNTFLMLQQNGIKVTPLVVTSSSLLVSERNRILEAFWISNCTHLLCVDSDLGWPPQAVLAMLEQDKEFIAGIYPARGKLDAFTFRPSLNKIGSIIQEKHLLKMEYIPDGFLLLSRNYQLLAALSVMIFGVIKINNSFLSSVFAVRLNKTPMNGKSARKGTEFFVLVCVPSKIPPRTTVSPSIT